MVTDKKYALLGVNTEKELNIGDYIQALASKQFLPTVDGFIQREKLKDYSGTPVRMIMNGWYMHNTAQWPPSEKIDPLFVAFHLNILGEEGMLTREGIKYLREHAPIGCRDKHTEELLKRNYIEAYFSGCMTLTLGYKYKSNINSGKIYFVDPVVIWHKRQLPIISLYCLFNIRSVKIIAEKSEKILKGMSLKERIKGYLWSAQFLRLYSSIFTKDVLLKGIYITQQSQLIGLKYTSDHELLSMLKNLLKAMHKRTLL